MKTIVCYGDSNTWGFDPASGGRLGSGERWTGVLQQELGEGYRVIEEGLNGRTTVVDDPIHPYRNGRDYLPPCLESHQPFDLVTIMLGTNDLKARFGRSASDIAESVAALAGLARNTTFGPGGSRPKVLVIAPPPLGKLTTLAGMFAGAEEKARRFGALYQEYAGWSDAAFLDAGQVIASSDRDGIHFEADEHSKLGQAVAAEVRRVLG